MNIDLKEMMAHESFRTAPHLPNRIAEAARLFYAGCSGNDVLAYARMHEAMSTSDFPLLLGAAFQVTARDAYEETVPEWQSIAAIRRVNDFRPAKDIDLFGGREAFDRVKEGEEYKARTLGEDSFEFSVLKYGNTFGLTWELRKNNQYHQLLDFPGRLGTAARATEDEQVFKQFIADGGPVASFFSAQGSIPATALSHAALVEAYKDIVSRKTKDKKLIRLGGKPLNLIVPAHLAMEAEEFVNEDKIPNGSGATKTNPLKGKFNIVVSEVAADLNSTNGDTAWYILPSKDSKHAAVGKVTMTGEETLDIRVRRDQGERVGGGAIGLEDGSYKDDTIDYRGRLVTGGAKLDTLGVYASKGA